jgi:hypothetical protein
MIWGNLVDPRVDLKGYTIEAFTLRQDSLTLNGTQYAAVITFSAIGFPEPSAAGVAGACGAVAGLCRRRRRQSR